MTASKCWRHNIDKDKCWTKIILLKQRKIIFSLNVEPLNWNCHSFKEFNFYSENTSLWYHLQKSEFAILWYIDISPSQKSAERYSELLEKAKKISFSLLTKMRKKNISKNDGLNSFSSRMYILHGSLISIL